MHNRTFLKLTREYIASYILLELRHLRRNNYLRNETNFVTIYTRFNRFKHCAINKEEKHKPMTRTDREAQAQHNDTIQESMAFFIRKIFANVKHASNGSFIAQYDSIYAI